RNPDEAEQNENRVRPSRAAQREDRAGDPRNDSEQQEHPSPLRAQSYPRLQSRAMNLDEQLVYLAKGSVDVIERNDLRSKLSRGKPLTIKAGFDPTAPDIHLGHTVLMRKMKHFQQLGHRVIFLIGDFTGLIGDPTGRKATRPALTKEEILANAETYKQQVFKILDPVKTEIQFNSEWLMALGADGMIKLAGKYTLARMLERDDFSKSFAGN